MGAANISSPKKDAMDLAKDLALAYGGGYRYIYAPIFVNSHEVKDSLLQDDGIRNALDLAMNADVILTSVGSIVYKSWSNYLSAKTMDALERKGVIGHIGGHFFDIHGNEPATSLAGRMIAICVAYGENKAEAVIGALRGRFINTLIIDEKCVEKILRYIGKME